MASCGMLHCADLVRTDVSEELNASIIRVRRIGQLGTQPYLATDTACVEALSSSKTSVRTRATRRNIPEDAILHSQRSQNLKSYIYFHGMHIQTTDLQEECNRSALRLTTCKSYLQATASLFHSACPVAQGLDSSTPQQLGQILLQG
jgi:hypothetical protein